MRTSDTIELSPLARAICLRLIRCLRHAHTSATSPAASITYGQLVAALGKRHSAHWRSPTFHAALTEITLACRARSLPSLPAIVWRSGTNRPSEGYYKVAHPRSRSLETRIEAWRAEYARVRDTDADCWMVLL